MARIRGRDILRTWWPQAVVLSILFLAVGFWYIDRTSTQIQQQFVDDLLHAAQISAASAPEYLNLTKSSQTIDWVEQVAQAADTRVTLLLNDGSILADSNIDAQMAENHAKRPEVSAALAGQANIYFRTSSSTNQATIYAAAPVKVDNMVIGVVRLAVPQARLDAMRLNFKRDAVAYLFMFNITTLAGLLFISWYQLRSLNTLVKAIGTAPDNRSLNLSSNHHEPIVKRLAIGIEAIYNKLWLRNIDLNSENQTLHSVLQSMRDGVIVVNADGTVQLVNPAAQVMFDVPVDARYPATLIEIVRSHQIVSFWKSITTERQNNSAYLEISIGTRTIQAFGINLSEQQAGKVLMVFHDISDIRQLEQVRKDFVANVSHELRTPMASIKALVETIQESYKDDPTRTEYFLDRIGIEIEILTQTIQELLELSRIESGKVPLKITAVAPSDLLASAESRMQPQAERAGITIHVEANSETPKVSADAERIEQVLVSLIHNAIKATPHGGTITLSASVVGEIVQFSITDTGCGIAPMDLERIFERFYKSDKSRTTPGTGLGLSIARHMIQQHGGKIWAESIETKGSTFYFTLPIAR